MKNILITGTSSGIGQEVAKYLSENGYFVIGTSRNPGISDRSVKTFKLDVNDDNSVENLVRKVIKEAGMIDVLINNAGYGMSGPIEDTSIEEAKEQFETNFFGIFKMTKNIIPIMRENGGGMIINISSIGGLIGLPFQAFYSASKFALEGFVEALRMEVKPFNIKVININPGDFKSSFSINRRTTKIVSNVYKSNFENILRLYEKNETIGSDPLIIAKLIKFLIEKENGHNVRYLVGKKHQKMAVFVKRLIGNILFEKIMMKVYKLK